MYNCHIYNNKECKFNFSSYRILIDKLIIIINCHGKFLLSEMIKC